MTQCRTFQCQEKLPGLSDCALRPKVEALQTAIFNLIAEAMPCNWDDEPEREAVWVAAMKSVGIDPEDMKEAPTPLPAPGGVIGGGDG